MAVECACAKHHRPDAQSRYDEVLHKVDNNVLSVKFTKDRHCVRTVDKHADKPAPTIDVACTDKHARRCKRDCPKVKVIHDEASVTKKPEEEILLLTVTRQITQLNDLKHSLEVEFKSPRNYIPLPKSEPSRPIIVPKVAVKQDKPEEEKEEEKKEKEERNKKKKTKKRQKKK